MAEDNKKMLVEEPIIVRSYDVGYVKGMDICHRPQPMASSQYDN